MADKQTIEQRVAHFLRLAEDASATQAERDLAAAQAERLMLKHAIDAASLDVHAEQRRVDPIITRRYVIEGTYADARMHAALAVVRAFSLNAYLTGGRGSNDIVIVGHESDVDTVEPLLRSLDTQAAVALRAHVASDLNEAWRDRGSKMVARRSFLRGFGAGAASRIRESRRKVIVEAEAAVVGTELVILDRTKAVNAAFADATRGFVTVRSSARTNNNAAAYGREAGKNANTGGTAIGAGRRGISA